LAAVATGAIVMAAAPASSVRRVSGISEISRRKGATLEVHRVTTRFLHVAKFCKGV
jgi:hypothetical protein